VDMCKYPLSIYNPVIKILFMTVIPIGLVSYWGIVQMDNIAWIFMLSVVISAMLLLVCVYLFEKAFRLYESTGS
ncbi:MAG: ABC-2 family transporter protein, partial [Lachnospiraceae bacterium]|nr:ABC-2 family transporter protein [Lachnospiraceae bacterium]